jgi:hypothetical protein
MLIKRLAITVKANSRMVNVGLPASTSLLLLLPFTNVCSSFPTILLLALNLSNQPTESTSRVSFGWLENIGMKTCHQHDAATRWAGRFDGRYRSLSACQWDQRGL